jgi:hypothetical protein
MSLGRADARFLLPFIPRSATVLGIDEWRNGLLEAGVDLEAEDAELVVASGRAPEESRARGFILEGARTRAPVGYASEAFLPLPSLAEQSLLVPIGRDNVTAYALDTWVFPRTWPRALRKRALVAFPRALGLLRRPMVTVASREGGQPALLAGARSFGVDPASAWFVVCGQGDELARGLFVVFPPGRREPNRAVKFARVPGYRDPFDRDQAGLELAATSTAAAAHAPRYLGRFEVAGYEASVETAAVGARLGGVLEARGSRARKLQIVESIADWLLEVALETRRPGGSAAAEVERLRLEVLPASPALDATALLGLEELPTVLQHNDLGSWNILVDRSGDFAAVDWESARAAGFPLWDLWYFLASVLPPIDQSHGDHVRAFVELFGGDAPSSGLVFARTREHVQALGIPEDAVGRLATLCWLHHGLSHTARKGALARYAADAPVKIWAASRYADAWLTDAALGPAWSRWREA